MVEAHARWLVASSAIALVAVASLAFLPPRARWRFAPMPDGWRLLFAVLLATQSGHVLEHTAQMVQLHILGLGGPQARGIVGALDLEWTHFAWSLWVLCASALLLRRFPHSRWLVLAVALGVWHELEHVVIMSTFLATGVVGTPGFSRPELHFLYNAMITIPLILAFRAETLRRARRATLAWRTA
ncbi:MAG: hypothetical protein AUH85_04345 [Chloroflexi bacterium 13_1_40CM_4_68_4]|nr:MAG: hypothetical protein AUH85_04345 [Chloroflexi bacterium 13_1_40CM_4_68_4]